MSLTRIANQRHDCGVIQKVCETSQNTVELNTVYARNLVKHHNSREVIHERVADLATWARPQRMPETLPVHHFKPKGSRTWETQRRRTCNEVCCLCTTTLTSFTRINTVYDFWNKLSDRYPNSRACQAHVIPFLLWPPPPPPPRSGCENIWLYDKLKHVSGAEQRRHLLSCS